MTPTTTSKPLRTGRVETRSPAAPSLFSCIAEDLQRVEERLAEETRSDVGAVRDISGHTLLAGGKRLRPALALLSARVTQRAYPADRVVAAAAAAEMIHMATLMHDDVVDASSERRGKPTANAVWGNGITVLTGDYLLAKSISLLAHNDDNLHVVRVFSDVTVAMAEGEVLQAAVARDLEITEATYEEIIDRKTARFLAGCCETGGMLAGADGSKRAGLRAYGYQLGLAFQIADDLLDLLGDSKKTGKPLGTDLRDGRVTLPLIHALKVADAEDRMLLRATLSGGDLSDADIATVTALIARHGGFEAARRVAEERAEIAVAHLARFPAGPYRDALERLARYVVGRDR
jgi:octaprenyl-diphosphate synthase